MLGRAKVSSVTGSGVQFGFLLGYSSFQHQRHLNNGVLRCHWLGVVSWAMSSDEYPKKIAPNSLMESYWFRLLEDLEALWGNCARAAYVWSSSPCWSYTFSHLFPFGPFGLDRQRIRIHFDDSRVSGDLQAAELHLCDEKWFEIAWFGESLYPEIHWYPLVYRGLSWFFMKNGSFLWLHARALLPRSHPAGWPWNLQAGTLT